MTNPFYNPSGNPGTGAPGSSLIVRNEFTSISTAFNYFPAFTGNSGKALVVNAPGTAYDLTTGALALGGNLTITGTNSTNFVAGANVNLTLPIVDGTLALLASPAFTGNPTSPTPSPGDNDTSIATTAFVVASFAPLASPALTGNPTAPTPASGDNDTSIATTAFVAAAVTPALNNVGRNLLDNSLFNIAQRGVGGFGAVTTGWTYSADRWALIIGAGGDTFTHSIIAINDAERAQIGDESATTELACNFTGGSGAANACLSGQFIEGVRRLAGKTVTVSFYALAAVGSPKLGVSLDQFFGSTGSPSATVVGTGQSVTVSSTTWARYSLTFAVPSISGKTLGTAGNDQTSLLFWHSAGANSATRSGSVGVQSGTHLIWGVQLEVGTVATSLEQPAPATDWAKCQRFYYTGGWNMAGYQAAGQTLEATFPLPTYMRAAPTIVTITTGTNGNATAVTAGALTPNSVLFYFNAISAGPTSANGTFTASADL